jgi:hypothetical protein
MNKDVLKKLTVKPTSLVQVVNAPSEFDFAQPGTEPVIIVFVTSQQDINKFVKPFCKKALLDELVLWCAYPKKSAKIKTDIGRDEGWDILLNEGLETVSLVSINETWSALRFRRKPLNSTKASKAKEKTVQLTTELKDLLEKNPLNKKFFHSLSYTNQKEYSTWISSAKRPETLAKRLAQCLDKLTNGKRNPSEK